MNTFALVKNYLFAFVLALLLVSTGCDDDEKHAKKTDSYSSDVVEKWLEVQTSMLFVQTGNPFGFNPSRYMAYCGVALYESVVPGMPTYQSLQGQLTDMPAMPIIEQGKDYHWPTCANAALASMTQKFFSSVTAVYNEQAITSLENDLNIQFQAEIDDATFERSVAFGKEVANKIFEWSKTDNAAWPSSYTTPAGDGIWKSETGAAPANPYWGYNRLMVSGSLNNAISQPLTYATDLSSSYYKDMKEVYDVSQNLTQEQKLIAKYFNDVNPGYPAGAHYISILRQVIEQFNPALDKAALTYAKTGITLFDASTSSFKAKYEYWRERPFSYIRSVIAPNAEPAWKSYLSTPGFPDFPSNHAVFSSSVAHTLSTIYGNQVAFTDAAYEGVTADLGSGPVNLGSRHYNSFDEMMKEISLSRLYGGIHYRYSCDEGMKQGKKVAQNIDSSLKFLK